METEIKTTNQRRSILPVVGIWTLEDLASYLNMKPQELQHKLEDKGIPYLNLGKHYNTKIIRLEDLRPTSKETEV
jgi:hypothetical protein